MKPSDFNLRHSEWRPHQLESVRWVLGLNKQIGILEAPTGSGKSAIARAVASRQTTVVLTHTKQLQQQYANLYGAAVVWGRANYQCALYPMLTAEECPHPRECAATKMCSYKIAKEQARSRPFTALNYAYALASRWLHEDERQIVILDEAHGLSDVTLDWAGCVIRDRDRVEFDLPDFPTIKHNTRNILLQLPDPVEIGIDYLSKCIPILSRYRPTAEMNDKERAHHRRGFRLHQKIQTTLNAMRADANAWFVRSGLEVVSGGPGFIARPLTARFHFSRLFLNGWTTIAMSATIGNSSAFVEELGVTDYDFRSTPSPFPPEQRRVRVLDVPRMGRSASPEDFEHQANAIADALKRFPRWSGLVLVTRKNEAVLLAKRLGQRGLADRVWVTPGADGEYAPTDEQVRAWEERRKRVPNSVCITWAFWQGYDGRDERICIVAKVPFPYLGDEYERERMEYARKFFLQRTAWLLEQGLGRTRRGHEEDYGDANGFVAIADGDWTRVRSYLSPALQEALG